jgi:hypothetical protein
MTIEMSSTLSRDLVNDPEWPLFRASTSDSVSRVPVCAFTACLRDKNRHIGGLDELAKTGIVACVEALADKFQYQLILFVFSQTLQPKSATVLWRKIWKSLDGPVPPNSIECRPEVTLDCREGVRFATTALVPISAAGWIIAYRSRSESTVPILLPKAVATDSSTALEWIKAALPPDGCRERKDLDFSWPHFASLIASNGGISIRRVDEYAEGSVGVDFFGPDSQAEAIGQLLAPLVNALRRSH